MRRMFLSARPLVLTGVSWLATGLILAAAPLRAATNSSPRPEILDSVHQRGSSDFSDMGSWIWETNTFDRQTVRFWKSFEIPADQAVLRARLRITADNEYTLYLDGREIGRDAEWRHLYEYDITSLLTPGIHVFAVEVYNSFNEAGMVLGMRVGLADGNVVEVKSDRSWLLVPEGIPGWEKKTEPGAAWRTAKVLVPFGAEPWKDVNYIDLVPPLQPLVIPFWQQSWFQISLLVVCVLASVISFWLMTQLVMHKKEKELLLRERGRIARDIHDDLGLRVTQLVLEGEVAKSDSIVGSEAHAHFGRMCEEAREALRAMDEVLWAINPRRDTLREFTTYVCGYARTFLKNTSIQCVLEVEPEMSSRTFELPLRRNLLLAVKEALNNAVKYSQATELLLKVQWQNKHLVLTVQDNGCGFDPAAVGEGRNGLTNMAERMREVGGEFQVTSQPGKGCRLQFSTPLVHPQPRFFWQYWRLSAGLETPASIVSNQSADHPVRTNSN